jgi:lysophospholipase L1-like esterase
MTPTETTGRNNRSRRQQQLIKKDVVVLWGGSNDIARNNSIVDMKQILESVINANHTNVILMSVPHRHDLIRNSCVNNEVGAFNRRLRKRLKRSENVEMIDVVSDRVCYTKQGQHLNSEGKENMSKNIAATIECLLSKIVDLISVKWYNDK